MTWTTFIQVKVMYFNYVFSLRLTFNLFLLFNKHRYWFGLKQLEYVLNWVFINCNCVNLFVFFDYLKIYYTIHYLFKYLISVLI